MKKSVTRRGILLSTVGIGSSVLAIRSVFTINGNNKQVNEVYGVSGGSAGGLQAEGLPYIRDVTIEENGWVLRVDGYWPKSSFADLFLDPDGSPGIEIRLRSPGFDRLNGWAAAADRNRTVVATRSLRKSQSVPMADITSLDETVHADGWCRLRFALSAPIYAGSTILGVDFKAGWRAGLQATTYNSTINGSTQTPELPSMRWASMNLARITSQQDHRIDLLVASGLAEAQEAVAAVRFIATDGTTVNVNWQTGASVSSAFGDNLKCWGVSLLASGLMNNLKPGLVTIHAEVYPWIGAMRSTGIAHTLNANAGFGYSAEVPLHVAWDPNGTRYPERHVFVDSLYGSASPAAVTVASTLANARAGTRAQTVSVALQAIYLNNFSYPAANGLPARTRVGDGAIITLATGYHNGFGSTPVTAGAQTYETRLILQGDPEDADARNTCILATSFQQPPVGFSHYLYRSFTLLSGNWPVPTARLFHHLDNLMIQDRPNVVSGTIGPFLASGADLRNSATRTRWWRSGTGFFGGNSRFGLLRSCEASRRITGVTIVNCATIPDPQSGPLTGVACGSLVVAGQAALAADQFRWGNSVRGFTIRAIDFPIEAGVCLRFRVVNNIFEKMTGGDTQPLGQLGEGKFQSARHCLLEGNTFIGERLNWGYNDPPTNALDRQNRHVGNCVRNNFFDWLPTKHDSFTSGTYGIRPGFTEGWSILYGVGYSNNIDCKKHSVANTFLYDFGGLGYITSPIPGFGQQNLWAMFADDRSRYAGATGAQGWGNYTPRPDSPLRNRCHTACIDVDQANALRPIPFAVGALD